QTLDTYGAITAYLKDDTGRVVKEIDPNGNQSEILHDVYGLAYAKRDRFGHKRRLPTDSTPHPLWHYLPATPAEWEQGRLHRTLIRRPAPRLEEVMPSWVAASVGPVNEAALRPPAVVA